MHVSRRSAGNFTRTPNDLLDGMARIRMSSAESRVFLVIIRQTLGFRKEWDWIALSQFIEKTGMNKQQVSKAIKLLQRRHMVIKRDKNLSINLICSQWKQLPKGTNTHWKSSKGTKEAVERHNQESSNGTPTKETNTKEKNTKENSSSALSAPPKKRKTWEEIFETMPADVRQIIDTMMMTFELPRLDGYPEIEAKKAAILLNTWVSEGKKRNIQDPRSWALQLICSVIIAMKADRFWSHRLTSMRVLEQNFVQFANLSLARANGVNVDPGHRGPRVFKG